MKISNLFKKNAGKPAESKSVIETLDKTNLKSVIGGGAINTTRSNIKSPSVIDDGSTTDPGTGELLTP